MSGRSNTLFSSCKNGISLSPSFFFSLFLLQCVSLPQTSSPTNCMYRTIPQPSQEPAWPCASGSSLQKRKFCSMTARLLSIISFIRCVQTVCLSFFVVCVCMGCFVFLTVPPIWPYLCRPRMMWRKASSKQSSSPTSCRSWRSRRRCPWSVSHIWTDATQLLYYRSRVTYTDRDR